MSTPKKHSHPNRKEHEPQPGSNLQKNKLLLSIDSFAEEIKNVALEEMQRDTLPELTPRAAIEEALRKQIHEYVHEIQDGAIDGYKQAIHILQKKHISDIASYTLTKEQIEHLKQEQIVRALESGEKTCSELLGWNIDKLLAIYTVGYDLYTAKKYKDASHVFLFLLMMHPRIPDFWSALGNSWEQLQRDKEAVMAFSMVTILEPDCIDSYLPVAKLLLSRGFHTEAKQFFASVIELASQLEAGEKSTQLADEATRYYNAL